MFRKRIKKHIFKKVIVGLLIALSIGGIFKYQHDTINSLKYNNQHTEQIINDTTNIDTSSISEKFNELKSYPILKGKVNIKHKYVYTSDKILGLESKYVLVGTEDYYYQYDIKLDNFDIMEANSDKIVISIDRYYINKEVCHGISDTFVKLKDESSSNVLTSKEDARITMNKFQSSLDKKGIDEISDYYSLDDKREYLDYKCKNEIINLLRELGYNQNITIKYKN